MKDVLIFYFNLCQLVWGHPMVTMLLKILMLTKKCVRWTFGGSTRVSLALFLLWFRRSKARRAIVKRPSAMNKLYLGKRQRHNFKHTTFFPISNKTKLCWWSISGFREVYRIFNLSINVDTQLISSYAYSCDTWIHGIWYLSGLIIHQSLFSLISLLRHRFVVASQPVYFRLTDTSQSAGFPI